MVEIVKVDVVPNVAEPVEGTHYNVVAGSPVLGDKVRITTLSGAIIFEGCYTPPTAPAPPPPKDKRADEFTKWLLARFQNAEIGLQKLLLDCRAQGGASPVDLDYQCRYFETWFLVTQNFTKADFTARTLPLTQTTPKILGVTPRQNAIDAW